MGSKKERRRQIENDIILKKKRRGTAKQHHSGKRQKGMTTRLETQNRQTKTITFEKQETKEANNMKTT